MTPQLCIKLSDTTIFLKHCRDAHKKFWHCGTNNFRRKIVTPLLCINFFDNLKVSETLKECLLFFRHCQTWNFRQKNVIHLIYINFTDTTFFLKDCRDAYNFFGSVRPKIFDRKMWYALFHLKTVPNRENLSKTVGINYKKIRTVRQNFFDGKTWYSLSCMKDSDYPKLSETLKGWLRIFSALWDLKFLTGKRDTP